jgi:hypothetical protein
MCMECGQTPCNPRCPNAPEPKHCERCSECGAKLYVGDGYYEVDGSIYCEDCMTGFHRYAEMEE